MNRAFVIVLLTCAALCARGQDALNAFTNRADQLLRPKWGFGVNEIPIFCSTNPLVRYNGGIHYLLQQAVNAYDQTNHTVGNFDFPSAFRPQFTVVSNDQCVTAVITNWVEVTNDYANIMARSFKMANDPTLSTDDNVWSVGLIVGSKPAVPTFNEFSYANTFNITRKLLFQRSAPATRPFATNQMYILGLSNTFGCAALNTWNQALPRDVTVYFTNSAIITLMNEVGAGVTNCFTNGITHLVLSNKWARYALFQSNCYQVFNDFVNTLSPSKYVEQTGQFAAPVNSTFEHIPGLPVHSWVATVTNQLVYGLIDNSSGRILDFLNSANFGTVLNLTELLQSFQVWQTNGADSSSLSPPSTGVSNQIQVALGNIQGPDYTPPNGATQYFTEFLNGTDTDSSLVALCPYEPSALIQQTATWWAVTPTDHCTIDEMASLARYSAIMPATTPAPFNPTSHLSTSLPIQITQCVVTANQITLQFETGSNQRYGIWSSTDLINWSFVGPADETSASVYTLTTPFKTNSPTLYFQARKL